MKKISLFIIITFMVMFSLFVSAYQTYDLRETYNAGFDVRGHINVTDGYVYFATAEGRVYQRNASNITIGYNSYLTGQDIYTALRVEGEYLYVGSYDDKFYQLAKSDLSLVSSYTGTNNMVCDSVTSGDSIYTCQYDGVVYQLNKTNVSQVFNTKTVAGNTQVGLGIGPDLLYVSDDAGGLYALNLTNISKQVASKTLGGFASAPVYYNGYVYINDITGALYQLNANTLATVDTVALAGGICSRPTITSSYLYIGCRDNKFYQVDITDIDIIYASYTTSGDNLHDMRAYITIDDGVVYFGSDDNSLYALNATNVSKLIDSYNTGGSIKNSVIVQDGYIYAGSASGLLYQFGDGTPASPPPPSTTNTITFTNIQETRVGTEYNFSVTINDDNGFIDTYGFSFYNISTISVPGGTSTDYFNYYYNGSEYMVDGINSTDGTLNQYVASNGDLVSLGGWEHQTGAGRTMEYSTDQAYIGSLSMKISQVNVWTELINSSFNGSIGWSIYMTNDADGTYNQFVSVDTTTCGAGFLWMGISSATSGTEFYYRNCADATAVCDANTINFAFNTWYNFTYKFNDNDGTYQDGTITMYINDVACHIEAGAGDDLTRVYAGREGVDAADFLYVDNFYISNTNDRPTGSGGSSTKGWENYTTVDISASELSTYEAHVVLSEFAGYDNLTYKWWAIDNNTNYNETATQVYVWESPYLSNPYLSIAGQTQWNYTGMYNVSQQPSMNITHINNILSDGCVCEGCVISGTNCKIPFDFYSDNTGLMTIGMLNTTYSFGLDNCSNSFNINSNRSVINVTFYDNNNNLVNSSYDSIFEYGYDNINYPYFTSPNGITSNFFVCKYPDWGTLYTKALIDYNNTFSYNVYGLTLNQTIHNIELIVPNEVTTEVTFTVIDSTSNPVEDAYIQIQVYDIITNTYKTNEIIVTDAQGQAIGNIVLATKYYRFIIQYQGETKLIDPETQGIKIYSLSRTFRISLDDTQWYDNYDEVLGISSELTFNVSGTNAYLFDWTNPSGSSIQGCLEVLQKNQSGQTLISSSCSSSSGAEIISAITLAPCNEYIGIAYFNYNGDIYTVSDSPLIVEYDCDTSFKGLKGSSGDEELVFFSWIIVIALAMIGIFVPELSIVLASIGLIGSVAIGFLDIAWKLVVAWIIIVIMLMLKYNKR